MTEQESQMILYESLLHKPGTRAEYYRRKAEEGNHDPLVFYLALSDTLKEITRYVNSFDYSGWGVKENGEREYYKNTLQLAHVTNGRVLGQLTAENIHGLVKPLLEYGKSVHKLFLQTHVKNESPSLKPARIKSLGWTGTTGQVIKLFDDLRFHGFIGPQTDSDSFTAIFTDDLTGCEPIQWRGSNRLMCYLFDQLYLKGYIVREWKAPIYNFKLIQNKRGEFFNASGLYTALSEGNPQRYGNPPIGSEKIDEILKNLKGG